MTSSSSPKSKPSPSHSSLAPLARHDPLGPNAQAPPLPPPSQKPSTHPNNNNTNNTNNTTTNTNGKLHHPSVARPPLRSNFDLEPNPFEQSFSSTSAVSQASTKAFGSDSQTAVSDHSIHPRDPDHPNPQPPHDPSHPHNVLVDRTNPSPDDSKPVLPPLASIVSPAEPFTGWTMSNSLRAGPLSPAMLAGPANQSSLGLGAFDSSFVRTGLTPDVSRTGFTPLIAGGAGAFPPPTPNTAALFAIVNGTSTGQPLSNPAATITPNTLNALNGVLNASLTVGANLDPQSNPGQNVPSQNYDIRHEPNGRSNGGAYAYQQDSYADTAAASALYLLSQQNAIRPQQQIAPSALTNQHDQHQHQHEANGSAEPEETNRRGATKRKSMDTPAAPATRAGKKAKATTTTATTAAPIPSRSSTRRRGPRAGTNEMDDDDDDDDDDQTYGGPLPATAAAMNGRPAATNPGGKTALKKPETEEEKRRNFLERNRQAALKCRQRKKKWLQDLQAKVECLTTENERLTNALIASREEIARLSQLVVAHGGAPSNLAAAATAPNDIQPQGPSNQHMSTQPVSINVSLPGVNKPMSVGVPLSSNVGHPSHQAPPQGVTVGRGYGY